MRIVGGEWGGRRIAAPPGRETRPTADRVREAWMSAVTPHLADARVLDLFAGSGALGLEALSRGAEHATFVESGAPALRVLRQNLDSLNVPAQRVKVVRGDAIRYVEDLTTLQFDVAFADPPYRSDLATRLAAIFRTRPFAALLCIEHSRSAPIPSGDDLREKRYGDTLLSFLSADNAR